MPVRTHDLQGRPYIQLANIKAGTKLRFDAGFGCLDHDFTYVARMDGEKSFVNCGAGTHMLEGENQGGYCVGVYAAEEC
jgi:hypothetical protein